MKKQIIILGSLFALTNIINGQNSNPWPTSGNVGIGTSSPLVTLDVVTGSSSGGIRLTQTTSGSAALYLKNTTTGGRNWALLSLGVGDGPSAGHFGVWDLSTPSANRLFISGGGSGQPTAGNVGIGTISPAAKLDVAGTLRATTNIEIGNGTLNPLVPLNIIQAGVQFDGIKFIAQSSGRAAFEIVQTSSQTNSRFKIFGDGSTYIGNFPNLTFGASTSMLTVAGDVRFAAYGTGNALGNGIEIMGNNQTPFRRGISVDNDNGNGAFNFFVNSNQSGAAFKFKNGLNNANLMTITPDAAVGVKVSIGTTKPQGVHADFKFSVDGKIVAQSLYITATSAWADYVFADDYKLPNLYDIEKYYQSNKHLPEIPSAAEVKENGINVGEMNALLLKKIEELTIHMVEQQKKIDELNKHVFKLK